MNTNSKEIFVYIVCAIGALTGLLFGFDSGVISGAILFIQHQFPVYAFSFRLAFERSGFVYTFFGIKRSEG